MKTYALVDDNLVEDSMFLRRTLGEPCLKRREPIIDPGQCYGSVLRDASGLWRMWYIVFLTRDRERDLTGCSTPLLLAYSNDGIEWEKPALNVVDLKGSDAANIILGERQLDGAGRYITGYAGTEGFCVLDNESTPHPCARARFTAMYSSFPLDSIGGILLAHSEDGIKWTAYPENPIMPGNQDTQNILIYDERIRKYVCFHRPMIYCGSEVHANRRIARSESEDLVHWSPGRMVLDTDELDAPAWDSFEEPGMSGQRGRTHQFQGLSTWISNGCYLGLAWFYDSTQGTFALELVHSADGIVWKREALRWPFIADDLPAGFKGKLPIPMGSPPVLAGDEEFIYCSNAPHGHHEVARADVGEGNRATRSNLLETTSIYLLSIKRDRWISYDAGEREGELLSTPINWEGGQLSINASIESGGYIHFGLEDRWGRPLRDSLYHLDEIPPLTGPVDAVDIPLTFGPGPKTILKFPDVGPVRFRFKMKHAKLFGWRFS